MRTRVLAPDSSEKKMKELSHAIILPKSPSVFNGQICDFLFVIGTFSQLIHNHERHASRDCSASRARSDRPCASTDISSLCLRVKKDRLLQRYEKPVVRRRYFPIKTRISKLTSCGKSYNTLSLHCLGNFLKSGNICAYDIVLIKTIFLSGIITGMENIDHNALKLAVHFFKCPAESFTVL